MATHYHTHFHHGNDAAELRKINKTLKKIMAKQEVLDAALARLESSAAGIAGDLQTLKAEIAAGTVSDASLARLDQITALFEALDAETPAAETPTEPTV